MHHQLNSLTSYVVQVVLSPLFFLLKYKWSLLVADYKSDSSRIHRAGVDDLIKRVGVGVIIFLL